MAEIDNIKSTLLNQGFKTVLDSRIYIKKRFIPPEKSEQLLEIFSDELQWEQPKVKIFGKEYPTPRLVAWYGKKGIRYKYSGHTHEAIEWTKELKEIQVSLENLGENIEFNSVLVNLYRNGNDKMGWHADNEKELGKHPIIASVNIGATRRMDFKHRKEKNEKHSIYLGDGDLLLMIGDTQENYLHQIPVEKKTMSSRINMTFRLIKP